MKICPCCRPIAVFSLFLEDVLPKNDTVDDYEIVHDFESIGKKTMFLNACKIREKQDALQITFLAIEDITDRKAIEASLEKTRKELAVIKIQRMKPMNLPTAV